MNGYARWPTALMLAACFTLPWIAGCEEDEDPTSSGTGKPEELQNIWGMQAKPRLDGGSNPNLAICQSILQTSKQCGLPVDDASFLGSCGTFSDTCLQCMQSNPCNISACGSICFGATTTPGGSTSTGGGFPD
jgi:hypothetical protein